MWVCAYVHTGDHRVKELETLKLDKQVVVVSCLTQVLGIELGSSARAIYAFPTEASLQCLQPIILQRVK